MEKNKKVAGELAKIKEDTVKDFLSMLPGASFNVNAGISENATELIRSIEMFFDLISDQMLTDDRTRFIRLKKISTEKELAEKEINSLKNEIQKIKLKCDKLNQEYERDKKKIEEKIKNARQETDFRKVRMEYETDVEIANDQIEHNKKMDEIKKLVEETRKKLEISKSSNIAKVQLLQKGLYKKEENVKMLRNRYDSDMIMRYKKKKSFQQSVESKKELNNTLKEKVLSMETHLKQLQSEEETLEQEKNEKLLAIRKKIAIRTISNFLSPYIKKKFLKKKPNKKTKKGKK